MACQPAPINPSPQPSASASASSVPSAEPTPVPSATINPEPTPVPTASSSQPSPTPEPTPTATPVPTPTPTAVPTPEPTPTPTPQPTPLSFGQLKSIAGTGQLGVPQNGIRVETMPFPNIVSSLVTDPQNNIWVLNGGDGILGYVTAEINQFSQQGDIKYRLYWEKVKNLTQIGGMVRDPKTGDFYLVQTSMHQIVRLNPETGTVEPVAGSGVSGYNGDRNALEANLTSPTDVAIDANGNLYITDTGNHLIRKVTPDGKMITIAGQYIQDTSVPDNKKDKNPTLEPLGETTGDGGPARNARVDTPKYIAADAQGAVYFTSESNTIRRIFNDQIERYAGSGQMGYNGSGVRADLAHINQAIDLTFGPDQSLYFIDSANLRVRRVILQDGERRIEDIAGSGYETNFSDGYSDPLKADIRPVAIGLDNTGNLYVYDGAHRRLRIVEVKK